MKRKPQSESVKKIKAATGHVYTVRDTGQHLTCSCAEYQRNLLYKRGHTCRHIEDTKRERGSIMTEKSEYRVKVEQSLAEIGTVEIPDLWHIAMGLKAKKPAVAAAVLETWYIAHTLLQIVVQADKKTKTSVARKTRERGTK